MKVIAVVFGVTVFLIAVWVLLWWLTLRKGND